MINYPVIIEAILLPMGALLGSAIGLMQLANCRCSGTGVIKYPWKVSVVLENGELPDFAMEGQIAYGKEDYAKLLERAKYRQVVE